MLAIYISPYFPDILATVTPECIPVMLASYHLSYPYRIQVGSHRRTIYTMDQNVYDEYELLFFI